MYKESSECTSMRVYSLCHSFSMGFDFKCTVHPDISAVMDKKCRRVDHFEEGQFLYESINIHIIVYSKKQVSPELSGKGSFTSRVRIMLEILYCLVYETAALECYLFWIKSHFHSCPSAAVFSRTYRLSRVPPSVSAKFNKKFFATCLL